MKVITEARLPSELVYDCNDDLLGSGGARRPSSAEAVEKNVMTDARCRSALVCECHEERLLSRTGASKPSSVDTKVAIDARFETGVRTPSSLASGILVIWNNAGGGFDPNSYRYAAETLETYQRH
jgi:hypothetical protein